MTQRVYKELSQIIDINPSIGAGLRPLPANYFTRDVRTARKNIQYRVMGEPLDLSNATVFIKFVFTNSAGIYDIRKHIIKDSKTNTDLIVEDAESGLISVILPTQIRYTGTVEMHHLIEFDDGRSLDAGGAFTYQMHTSSWEHTLPQMEAFFVKRIDQIIAELTEKAQDILGAVGGDLEQIVRDIMLEMDLAGLDEEEVRSIVTEMLEDISQCECEPLTDDRLIYLINQSLLTIELPRGEQGERGEQGLQGERGEDGRDGIDGTDGQDGLSAFELAIQQGFSGTLEEWLESLRGEDGRDGIDGIDGVDGDVTQLVYMIEEAIAQIEFPESLTEEQVIEIVNYALANLEMPDGGITEQRVQQLISEALDEFDVEVDLTHLITREYLEEKLIPVDNHLADETIHFTVTHVVQMIEEAIDDMEFPESLTEERVREIAEEAVSQIEFPEGITEEEVRQIVEELLSDIENGSECDCPELLWNNIPDRPSDFTNLSTLNELIPTSFIPTAHEVTSNHAHGEYWVRTGSAVAGWINLDLAHVMQSSFMVGDQFNIRLIGFREGAWMPNTRLLLRYVYDDDTWTNASITHTFPVGENPTNVNVNATITNAPESGRRLSHIRIFLERDGQGAGFINVRQVIIQRRIFSSNIVWDNDIPSGGGCECPEFAWDNLTGIPETFPPKPHDHEYMPINGHHLPLNHFTSSIAPNQYPLGLSQMTVGGVASGFPFNGSIATFRYEDGKVEQMGSTMTGVRWFRVGTSQAWFNNAINGGWVLLPSQQQLNGHTIWSGTTANLPTNRDANTLYFEV